ncbi:MAG: DUF1329 domain-containing protein [Candidatus Binataceae bacterium]
MKFAVRLMLCMAVVVWSFSGIARAADATIAPGTQITMSNWRQYKQFMPDTMVSLFQGTYFWKMPSDVEIDIGPAAIHPLPKGYLDATEKYAPQAKLVELPDGGLTIQGYVAGEPFPSPSGPHKGWKILADMWYRYVPYLIVSTAENPIVECSADRYGNVSCEREVFVARVLKHITDPGVAMANPQAGDHDETRFGMIIEPETEKYSALLSIYYNDLTRLPSSYQFKPAERRVVQLSSAARCMQSGGSDFTADDYRYGFAGSIPTVSANLLGEKKIIAQLDYKMPGGTFPANFDMPLGFPKPDWGKWELRDVYVLDVRKIPSQASGYCYGKRIMYIDQQFLGAVWADLYDKDMKLWKIFHIAPQVTDVPGIGVVNNAGGFTEQLWDVQNDHGSFDTSYDNNNHAPYVDAQVPKEYNDVGKYSTVEGLNEIMR